MSDPRAYTAEEVRKMLLDSMIDQARYWADLPDKSTKDRCEGVVFSLLNILDGTSMGLPAFDLIVKPHPDDKAYAIENGENWFEPDMLVNDCMLHEMLYK